MQTNQRYATSAETCRVVGRKLTVEEIRVARAGTTDNVNATAAKLGIRNAEVHRAIGFDSLTLSEKDAIEAEFLGGRFVKTIAESRGIAMSAVLEVARTRLIHAKVEAGMLAYANGA
ncbi:hypothetical protein [Paraburkholderia sediminicola]|uniref:hypothetical protein n=1 Tax=Paraburkholderia sediminicola TaxID=458836 RepID=UPI0038B8C81B